MSSSATASSLSTLVSKEVWVYRGNGLRFSIRFVIDNDVKEKDAQLGIIEHLGAILRDAELWLELSLKASLTHLTRDSEPSEAAESVLISLSHTERDQTWRGTSSAGYTSVIASDTRPPGDVQSASLEEVNITFTFSKLHRRSRPKRRKMLKLDSTKDLDGSDMLFTSGDESENQERLYHSQPGLNTASENRWDSVEVRRTLSQPAVTNAPEDTFEKNADDVHYGDTHRSPMLLPMQRFSDCSATEPNGYPVSGSLRKRSGSNEQPLPCNLDLVSSVKLIDAALRTLICDHRTRSATGIKLQSKTPGPKLATISPALFSPGYLQAVSQRSHFHSTIAHSICSVQRHTKSAMLKQVLEQLLDSSSTEQHDSAQKTRASGRSHEQRLIDVLKIRLWYMTQRTLFNPLAALKLKPLSPGASITTDQYHTQDLMLDEDSVPDLEADMNSSTAGEEHDDLFLNEESIGTGTLTEDTFSHDKQQLLDEFDEYELLDEYDEQELLDEYDDDNDEELGSYWSDGNLEEDYSGDTTPQMDPSSRILHGSVDGQQHADDFASQDTTIANKLI